MLAAAGLFSLMGALTKAATRGTGALAAGEIALFRYAFGLLFLVGMRAATGADILGVDRRGLLWRGVWGGISSVLFFLGIEHTLLTNAILLNFTYVVWAPLLAVYSLGERLGWRGMLALGAALGGIALVTRPEIGTIRAGDIMALSSGIIAGAAVVQIRRLRQGESSYAVFFYFNLFGLPCALAALLLSGAPFLLPQGTHLWILLGIGATSVSAQLLMTYGYREMTAAQGSLLTLTSAAFSALLAHFVFGEALPLLTLVGGALIVVAATSLALAPRAAR